MTHKKLTLKKRLVVNTTVRKTLVIYANGEIGRQALTLKGWVSSGIPLHDIVVGIS